MHRTEIGQGVDIWDAKDGLRRRLYRAVKKRRGADGVAFPFSAQSEGKVADERFGHMHRQNPVLAPPKSRR